MSKKQNIKPDISQRIINYIIDNDLMPDTRLPTAAKMAIKYGVAPVTVNRALNKLVESGCIYRIQGSGTYVGKNRQSNQSAVIGFFAWQREAGPLASAAYGMLENIVKTELQKYGFKVDFKLKSPPGDNVFSDERLYKYDALIISAGMATKSNSQLLKKLNIPIVSTIGEYLLPHPFHQVFVDYAPGFEQAVDYLKKQGCRKIYLSSMNRETSNIRRDILLNILKQCDLEYEELPFSNYSQSSHLTLLAGRKHGQYIIDNKIKGFVVTLSDFLAFGMIDAFIENNIELGRDVKLLSYDNLESHGVKLFPEPLLTSITHPIQALAGATVDLVRDVVRNELDCNNINKIIRVPATELVIRKTA
jgi:DNA-binding LacI/PurR family transcriptional regulator